MGVGRRTPEWWDVVEDRNCFEKKIKL